MKFRAEIHPHGMASKVMVDDQDITTHVNSLNIDAKAGELVGITVRLVPTEIVHVDASDVETLLYTGINGEQLVSVADAAHLWHCGCGTWNHVASVKCRVCGRKDGARHVDE